MKFSDIWFSTIAQSENNTNNIFVTGRDDLAESYQSGKYNERVEIHWHYKADNQGLPIENEGKMLEDVTTVLRTAMESKDHLAVLTGIYTGDGERTMVFYARNSRAFGERLNKVLEPFPLLPITLFVEHDPHWDEYREMYSIKEDDGE